MKIKVIPDEFRKNGLTHTLMEKDKNWAIYRQHDPKGLKPEMTHGFELHRVRVRKYRRPPHFLGVPAPEANWDDIEILASNEEFGTYGWSCFNFKEAQERASELA